MGQHIYKDPANKENEFKFKGRIATSPRWDWEDKDPSCRSPTEIGRTKEMDATRIGSQTWQYLCIDTNGTFQNALVYQLCCLRRIHLSLILGTQ